MANETPQTGLIGGGHDAPSAVREEDAFDRWQLAARIVDVAESAPSDWSTRIAIYGRWGEGKTSVLKFSETLATDRGHLCMWLNPVFCLDADSIWRKFEISLRSALSTAGLKFAETSALLSRKQAFRLFFANNADRGNKLLEFHPIAKAIGGGLGLVAGLLNSKREQVEKLRSALGTHRVFVFIDDLDRVDPKLIPLLLLTLRDVLDIPQFNFVLAFDDHIVSDSLKGYNPAWADGREFLDKIIDFPFPLATPSRAQIETFARSQFARICEFVPVEALNEVLDLMPENPRKLKLYLRSIASLRKEAIRHGPAELNWVSVLLLQMLRQESVPVAQALTRQLLAEEVTDWLEWVMTGASDEKDKEIAEKAFRTLASKHDPSLNGERLDRVVTIGNSWKVRKGIVPDERSYYMATFADFPHALTWGEFDKVLEIWRRTKSLRDVETWLSNHCYIRGIQAQKAARELFESTVGRYRELLEKASDEPEIVGHDSAVANARIVFELIRELFQLGLESVGTDYFATSINWRLVHRAAERWFTFNLNAGDIALRKMERDWLFSSLERIKASPSEVLEALEPWASASLAEERELSEFRKALAASLESAVADESFRLFNLQGGIAGLLEDTRHKAAKYELLRPGSPVFTEPQFSALLGILSQAKADNVVQSNCIAYLDLINGRLEYSGKPGSREDVLALVKQQRFVEALWGASIARTAQARFRRSHLRRRDALIKSDVPEEWLPVPQWLKTNQQEEMTKAASLPAKDPAEPA